MDTKSCFIVCTLLLTLLFGCLLISPLPASGTEIDQTVCMEVRYWNGVPTSIINQTCLMRLYNVELAQIQSPDVFLAEKPKTKLCKVVKHVTYGSSSIFGSYSVIGWTTEVAECVVEE